MNPRTTLSLVLLSGLAAGCSGGRPPMREEPVEVTITVTLPDGKPGKDLQLLMLPTSSMQIQGGGRTDAKGKVTTKLTPGKYTYAFDYPPKIVPPKYHQNQVENSIEVARTDSALSIGLTQ